MWLYRFSKTVDFLLSCCDVYKIRAIDTLVIIRLSNVVYFELIHNTINLDVISSSKSFSEFDYVFLYNVLLLI